MWLAVAQIFSLLCALYPDWVWDPPSLLPKVYWTQWCWPLASLLVLNLRMWRFVSVTSSWCNASVLGQYFLPHISLVIEFSLNTQCRHQIMSYFSSKPVYCLFILTHKDWIGKCQFTYMFASWQQIPVSCTVKLH